MPTRFVPLSQFDRLAASFFGPSGRPTARLDRQIPVDAYQHEDRLVLLFDLPGVAEDAIELSLERRVLTVRASRGYAIADGDNAFLAERPWGEMSRQIVLGESLDTERVNAGYEQGVLTVTIPVAEKAKTRKIEISHAPVNTTGSEVSSGEPQNN
jgi:HSP20 family protein